MTTERTNYLDIILHHEYKRMLDASAFFFLMAFGEVAPLFSRQRL